MLKTFTIKNSPTRLKQPMPILTPLAKLGSTSSPSSSHVLSHWYSCLKYCTCTCTYACVYTSWDEYWVHSKHKDEVLLYTHPLSQKRYISHFYMQDNVLSLVLKARHFRGSAFWNFRGLGDPEQALGGGITLGFGSVVDDRPSELYTRSVVV